MATMKTYIGDSVYAEINERGLTLTTENGLGPSNTIILEPGVWEDLKMWVKAVTGRPQKEEMNEVEKGI